MLKGWIAAEPTDQTTLEACGVIVGEYNNETGEFENCVVSIDALGKLDEYWGRFYWGLYE